MECEGEVKTHIAHFRVDGEGLTRIVRDMYCYEYKQMQALDILEGLHGITISQAKKVCTGEARLEDRNNDGLIYYVEEPDREFMTAYTDHKIWLEHHLEEEARELKNLLFNVNTPRKWSLPEEELITIGKRIATGQLDLVNKQYFADKERERSQYGGSPYMDNIAKTGLLGRALRAAYPEAYEEEEEDENTKKPSLEAMTEPLTQTGISNEPVIPEPSKETVKVGKWNVPKNLMDRYSLHVVKRIRKSIRNREIPDSIDGVTELYHLEMERQALHDAICKALGFDHDAKERNEDQVDFDNALQDYLDKHAGSLFSGDA
jgi:hypothetical protein